MQKYIVISCGLFFLSWGTMGLVPGAIIIDLFDSRLHGDNVWPLALWYGTFFPIGIILSGYLNIFGIKENSPAEDQLFRILLINLSVPLGFGILLYKILKSILF